MTLAEKILARVVVDDVSDCWNWQGAKVSGGYGRTYWERRPRSTHRAMYEAAKGPIPDGLQIDHLCRNPSCCNPDHLEAVTPGENTRRGLSPMLARLRRHAKTHCDYGHAFTSENSYFDARGYRSCKECRREKNDAWGEMRRRRRGISHAESDAPKSNRPSPEGFVR